MSPKTKNVRMPWITYTVPWDIWTAQLSPTVKPICAVFFNCYNARGLARGEGVMGTVGIDWCIIGVLRMYHVIHD